MSLIYARVWSCRMSASRLPNAAERLSLRCATEPDRLPSCSPRPAPQALAAKNDMGVVPADKGQTEVIEPVVERHTGDADAVVAQVGKIGQPEPDPADAAARR